MTRSVGAEVINPASSCCLFSGLRLTAALHGQQPAADDVPGPTALVVHLSDLLLHEPAEDAAAAASGPPAPV